MILWRHQPPVFSIPIPDQQLNRTRFFKSWLRRIAPVTHQDQAISAVLLSPWRSLPPQKIVGAASRPIDFAQIHGYRIPMPTPCWLALQAIRFVARATANGIPFRFMAGAPDPFAGLAVAVVTHAKQRAASNGFCSFSMW
jgi:hypothetical protein